MKGRIMWMRTMLFTTLSKIKSFAPLVSLVLACCFSCITVDHELGMNMVADSDRFTTCADTIQIKDMRMARSDSMSGFSTWRMTFGSVRDDVFGLSRRMSAFPLIPMYDTLDFGINPVVRNFHFAVAFDTMSVVNKVDAHMLQGVRVFPLLRPIDPLLDYNCNADIPHGTNIISDGIPVINGRDSLSFNFSREYAESFLALSGHPEILSDIDKYLKLFPGIYIETEDPVGNGGRINMYEFQLGFNPDEMMLTGNLARLTINTRYPDWDEPEDTTFFFYLGADAFYDIDSLLTESGSGNFPEYCLNLTTSEEKQVDLTRNDKLYVEGGGGVKPVIGALALREQIKTLVQKAIREHGLPETKMSGVVINKASLVLPFQYPGDYTVMFRYPDILSPTLRSYTKKTRKTKSGTDSTYYVRAYASITDSSSDTEDQGDINRNPLEVSDPNLPDNAVIMSYKPDITYYVQNLMTLADDDANLLNGDYDIWFMVQSYETLTSTTSISDEMEQYYQYLAYQSYYNNMYQSSGTDYYSNYYSYMLAAQYASGSSTTTTTSLMLDRDRYYHAVLRGPGVGYGPDACVPYLKIIFSIPTA